MHQSGRSGRVVRLALIVVPALALVVVVAARDVAAALAVAGLGVLLAGFLLLVVRSPVGRRGRTGAVTALAIGGAGLFLGGTAFAAPLPGVLDASAALTARPSASAAPAGQRPLASAALAALPVKGPAPMTGYRRTADFGPAWADVDRNGCDTRNDVLRRDLVHVAGSRCKVVSGVLHDPYTGRTIRFVRGEGTSEAVQIDHVVALADAWRTGAQGLSGARREALANDPVNLYAVDGPTNTQKSDGDAATWLPKRKAFRCTYVAHQIAVKRAYGLWVVPAERAAIARVLRRCPEQRLPALVGAVGSAATPEVSPGAFCADAGAAGRTAAGTAMRCSRADGEARPRWRRA